MAEQEHVPGERVKVEAQVTEEERAAVDQIAARDGLSRAAALRRLVAFAVRYMRPGWAPNREPDETEERLRVFSIAREAHRRAALATNPDDPDAVPLSALLAMLMRYARFNGIDIDEEIERARKG